MNTKRYDVRLTVTDDNGNERTTDMEVYAHDRRGAVAEAVSFTRGTFVRAEAWEV